MATLDRRRFLALTAGGLAAAGLGTAQAHADTASTDPAPSGADGTDAAGRGGPRAIVIGSGFGGAVAALRLGRAGIRTTVLERGRWWQYSPTQPVFGDELNPNSDMFWFQDTATWPTVPPIAIDKVPGVLEVTQQNGVTVACGAAVGGGSIVYTGCTVQPPQRYFEQIYPSTVTYREMDTVYWPRVRRMLGAQTIPQDLYGTDPFTHSRAFDEQMRLAGYPTTRVPTTFNWDKVRAELAGTLRPSAIIGESTFGNSDGAKNDVTQNYLPAALATRNVHISPLTEVTAIGRGRRGGYTVQVRRLSEQGTVVGTEELACDLLFLAAGSVNTTRLLVAARDTGALPDLDASVGTGWGTNGDAFGLRTFAGATGDGQAAPCVSTTFVDSGFGMPIRVENWYAMAFDRTAGMAQFSVAVDMDNRGTWRYDPATGQVALADWTAAKNAPSEAAAVGFNQMIIDKGLAGPAPVPNPTGLTAHPLGGCAMGGAADTFGRVRGNRGLYVVDGALVPGNIGGANPSLTIAALAERALDDIVAHAG
ncbi:GMC oxidoreductase [Yinghuangia seranimata]|uniref:GMC oxidoreductase n=1 Tax=Yinghuangia seranimata TaxID=408067 RepID=UPI00248AFDE3|nr:GMC oxidoreductase [Yinghuangia seranimata]MDI2127661.1 GMC oxidoreductase [Yinghuangia seranimata]